MEEKFEEFYDTYRGLMFRIADRILKNKQDAEDVVHEAFEAIFKQFSKISEIHCPKTRSFVVIVVERKALDFLRKKKVETVPFNDETIGVEVFFDEEFLLERVIAGLKPQYRELILLKYVHGYSTSEIAELFGQKHAAVQKTMWRAKNSLRERLREDGVEI